MQLYYYYIHAAVKLLSVRIRLKSIHIFTQIISYCLGENYYKAPGIKAEGKFFAKRCISSVMPR